MQFTSSIRHAQHAVVVPERAGDGGVARGPVAAEGSEAAALNEAKIRIGDEAAGIAVADMPAVISETLVSLAVVQFLKNVLTAGHIEAEDQAKHQHEDHENISLTQHDEQREHACVYPISKYF